VVVVLGIDAVVLGIEVVVVATVFVVVRTGMEVAGEAAELWLAEVQPAAAMLMRAKTTPIPTSIFGCLRV
jgi:hypothetical protein